jgi:sugar/nucleoside kinase (ribokinase family)
MSRARFFMFGNISIDDLVFADGSTMWCVPGGNAVYSALGAAVWGERPRVMAPIGPEYPAGRLGDRIDLTHCRLLERNLRNWGLYEEDGTRHFTFRSKTRNWLDFSPALDDLDDGPYTYSHLAPLPWQLHVDLAETLRARGAELISVDPDDRRLSEVPLDEVKHLLGLVDVFMPSRQDAHAIFPGRSPLDALKAIRDLVPELPVVVVKCGAAGAVAHRRGAADYVSVPTVAEKIVDETGAGDAFCGGAMAGFARKQEVIDALARAAVSASFAVEAVGAAGLVDAAPEVAERRLERLCDRIEVHAL